MKGKIKYIILKTLFAVLLPLSLISASAPAVFAVETVNFYSTDVECANNRLFYVEITAQCSENLSAATFEITYDDSVIEFREVSSDDSGVTVSSTYSDGGVKMIYLCGGGKNIQTEAVIFKLKFKSVSLGSSYISISASDCVNSGAERLAAGVCDGSTVTVKSASELSPSSPSSSSSSSGSSGGSSSSKSASGSSQSGGSSKSPSVSDGSDGESEASEAEYDDFGFFSYDTSGNEYMMFIVGIMFGFCIIVTFALAFVLGRQSGGSVKSRSDKDKHSKRRIDTYDGGGFNNRFNFYAFSAYNNMREDFPQDEDIPDDGVLDDYIPDDDIPDYDIPDDGDRNIFF